MPTTIRDNKVLTPTREHSRPSVSMGSALDDVVALSIQSPLLSLFDIIYLLSKHMISVKI